MRKRDCTNCGWGVEWELVFNSRGEATLRGRCRFQPMPKLCDCLRTTIGPKAKPATDCPAWKKASGPVPPWGVWTDQWRVEMYREIEREAWEALSPKLRKELQAMGLTRP